MRNKISEEDFKKNFMGWLFLFFLICWFLAIWVKPFAMQLFLSGIFLFFLMMIIKAVPTGEKEETTTMIAEMRDALVERRELELAVLDAAERWSSYPTMYESLLNNAVKELKSFDGKKGK